MASPRPEPAPGTLRLGTETTDLVRLLLAGCTSDHTRSSYAKGIFDLTVFLEGRPLTPGLLLEWRAELSGRLAAASVNLRMAAVRKLVRTARARRRIAGDEATELLEVRGMPWRGTRSGNWLTPEQVKALLTVPDRKTLRGKRNFCILAVLLGCALRRYELADLTLETIQQRDGRWALVDLQGKGGRVRTVAVPGWVKQGIDEWTAAAKIRGGRLIRQLTGHPRGLSHQAIWDIVSKAAAKIGVQGFGPHDLRRTCAKLCRRKGGEIEQIQFMLGHASIQTTERYLGTTQNLVAAVNDDLGI